MERDGVLTLSPDDAARVHAYHERLLGEMSQTFDVDVLAGQKSLSLGMRIAAAFGAGALGVSIFLFFYHFWGDLSTSSQVVLLTIGPIPWVVAMVFAARRERTLYITSIIGMMSVAAFVLDLYALGQIFNMVPTPNAFLAWSAFAAVLAYTFRLRSLLAFALLAFAVWLSTTLIVWSGLPGLDSAFQRFETYLLAGALILVVATQLPRDDFAPTWRGMGAFVFFGALLVISVDGQSIFFTDPGTARTLYQLLGLVTAAGAIWISVRQQWTETVTLTSIFFALFLLERLVDWLWDLLPNYLFFLVIGLLAIGLIAAFRRVRASVGARA